MKKPVQIRIDSTTREELHSLKKVGDTYDDVVRRLMHLYRRAMSDDPETLASWIRHCKKEG